MEYVHIVERNDVRSCWRGVEFVTQNSGIKWLSELGEVRGIEKKKGDWGWRYSEIEDEANNMVNQ